MRHKLLRFLLLAIFLSLIFFTNFSNQDPDAKFSAVKYFGVIFLCSFVVAGCVGWGTLIVKKIFAHFSLDLVFLFGTLFLCVSSFLFLIFGFVGPNWQWLWILFLGVGVWQFPWGQVKNIKGTAEYVVVGVAFFVLLVLALVPQSYPDPLYYHLLAIRKWYDAEGLKFFTDQPLLFQAGLWEMLYFYPLQIVAPLLGQDLIGQQICAQILHFSLGFFGVLFVGARCLRIFDLSPPLIWAFVIISSSYLLETSITAKNDSGVLLWSLGALCFLLEREKSPNNSLLSALFMGVAISCKWSIGVAFLPFFLYLLYEVSGNFRALGSVGAAFLLGLFPIALRNLVFTKTPFFPLGVPPKILSETDTIYFATYYRNMRDFSLPLVGHKIVALFRQHPFNFLAAVGVLWAGNLRGKKIFLLFIVSMVSILVGFFSFPEFFSWRITVLPPILVTFFSVVIVRKLGKKYFLFGGVLPAFAFLVFFTQLFFLAPRLPFTQNPTEEIRKFPGGDAMAWLRMYAAKDQKILAGGNAELYYVSGLDVVNLESSALVEEMILKQSTFVSMVQQMRSLGFRWFLETYGNIPRGRIASYFARLATNQELSTLAYQGIRGRVWDLQILSSRVLEKDFQEPKVNSQILLEQQK